MLNGVVRREVQSSEPDIQLSAIEWPGDGRLCLLLHATGFCAAMWDPVAARISDTYHVVGYDARGHGDSSKPAGSAAYVWDNLIADLITVASDLSSPTGTGVALAVGHSMGGAVLLAGAARRPDLFGRVVAVDPVVCPSLDTEIGRRVYHENMKRADSIRRRRNRWGSRDEARAGWAGSSFFAAFDPEVLDLYAAEGLASDEEGFLALKCPPECEAAVLGHAYGLDPFSEVVGMEVPVTIVRAHRGHFPPEYMERLAAPIKHCEIVEIDCGHLVPMEAPSELAAVIRAGG